MQMHPVTGGDRITLGPVRYNPQAGAFEARVDIRRGDRTYRYPAQVAAPLDADPHWIDRALTDSAVRMSDSPDLRSVIG